MEQKDNICSLCSAPNTSKVKYFQLKDAIRPPDDTQLESFTELHGILENILNIKGEDRKARNDICQKCRDKLHGIYSFTLQHSESKKMFHQMTDVTVRLKKLKTVFISSDLKKEFEDIAETDKDVNSLECGSKVCYNYDVSDVVVKMECDNNFEGVDFNKVMKDLNVKDGISVEQEKIDSMGSEDMEQITIEDEIIKEESTLQEGVIFESKAKHDILDREQKKFGCDACDEEFSIVSCPNKHKKNVREDDSHEFNQATVEYLEGHIQRFDNKNEFACDQCDAKYKSRRGLKDHKKFHAAIPVKCDQCDTKFKNKTYLAKHQLAHPNVLPTYKCDDCNTKFTHSCVFWRHKVSCEYWKCVKCDVRFSNKRNLWRHLQKFHPFTYYFCDQCDAKFKTNENLERHKESHGIFFKCDQCDGTYKSKQALKRHKESHTVLTFTCNECGDASFFSKRSLNSHLRYACPSYKKKKDLNLNVHKLNHNGISFN